MNSDRDGIRGGWATPGDDQSDAESAVETTGEFTIDYAPPAWYTQNASGSSEGASPTSSASVEEEEESGEAKVSDGSDATDGAGPASPANGADGAAAAAAGVPATPSVSPASVPSFAPGAPFAPPAAVPPPSAPVPPPLLTVVRLPFRGCLWGVGSSLRLRLPSRLLRVLPVCRISRTSRLRRWCLRSMSPLVRSRKTVGTSRVAPPCGSPPSL